MVDNVADKLKKDVFETGSELGSIIYNLAKFNVSFNQFLFAMRHEIPQARQWRNALIVQSTSLHMKQVGFCVRLILQWKRFDKIKQQ